MKLTWSKITFAFGFVASSSAFSVAHAVSLVGINSSNQIAVFESSAVSAASFVDISGIDTLRGESLIGIDLRPSNNTIYGISTFNKIYTVNVNSGEATYVSTLSQPIINASLGYGFDFNPSADFAGNTSLRLVTSAGNNYAVNVNSGVVGNAASNIGTGFSGVAYTNSNPSGPLGTPTLYYINSETNSLHENANTGNFNSPIIDKVGDITVNGIQLDILKANGFEIFSDGFAFAAVNLFDSNLKTQLLGINIDSGASTYLGEFNGTLNGLAAAPSAVPVPAAAWLFGSALIGFAGFRRKSV